MANDVSSFKLSGGQTLYNFNDATAEAAIAAEVLRAQAAEGNLSSLNTSTQTSLVAAINELKAAVDRVFYAAGDTYSQTAFGQFAGTIGSGATSIYFDVPMPKNMANVNVIGITTLEGNFYGVGGLVDGTTGSTNLLTTYSCSATRLSATVLRFVVEKSTAMTNATQYTPVTANVKIGITFSAT